MYAGKPGHRVRGSFADSAPLDDRTIFRITELLAVLGALFLLDITTTHIILLMGGVELNPLMVGIVANPVLHAGLKGAILLFIFSASVIAELHVRGSSVFFYGIIILLYLVVVLNNVLVILPRFSL